MNSPETAMWLRLFGILALEICLVVASIFALQRMRMSPFWRRALWQAGLVCLLLLTLSELSGAGRGLAGFVFGRAPTERQFSVRVTIPTEPAIVRSPRTLPVIVSARNATRELTLQQGTWWPGIVWLAGFVLVAARIVFAQVVLFRFRRRQQNDCLVDWQQRAELIAARLGYRGKVRLLQMRGITSPMAFGLLWPTIGLPKNFTTDFSSAQQDAMLAHELAHLAARDPLWYLLADFVTAILWWHPLTWWSRRRFHAASEMAADSATAIFENGPGALAECLLTLGRQFSGLRRWSALGVDGGFRSNLGRRIQSLLNLKPSHQPARGWKLVLTKVCLMFLLVGVFVFASGWIQNGQTEREKTLPISVQKSWDDSMASIVLGALLTEAPVSLAKETAPFREVKPPVIATNTANSQPVGSATSRPQNETTTPAQKPTLPVVANVSTNQLLENAKLFYEMGQYKDAEEILKGIVKADPSNRAAYYYLDLIKEQRARENLLRDESRTNDELLHPTNPPKPVERTGLAALPNTLPVAHASDVTALYTKIFKVNPGTFLRNLEKFESENGEVNALVEGLDPLDLTPKDSVTVPPVHQQLRAAFAKFGVKLDEPGKSLLYKDRLGWIYVHGTLSDLEAVEAALAVLNTAPPQLTIEAKFVEVDEAAYEKLGANWLKQRTLFWATNQMTETRKTNLPPLQNNKLTEFLTKSNSAPSPGVMGILTDEQYRIALRTLKDLPGTEVTKVPNVTTLSGRQAHISVSDMRTIVTSVVGTNDERGPKFEFQTAPIPFGPALDVMPSATADGMAVDSVIVMSVSEFLGYDDAGEYVVEVKGKDGGTVRAPMPLPRTLMRQAVTGATVWDGQTIVLGGMIADHVNLKKSKVPVLGDLPFLKKLFRNENKTAVKKNIFVFVTPTFIDAAGNRLHSEDEMPFARNSVPAQSREGK